jgi:hypothetical protein
VLIEDKAAGTQLIQELIRNGLHAVSATSRSRQDHAQAGQTAMIENGFVHLPKEGHGSPNTCTSRQHGICDYDDFVATCVVLSINRGHTYRFRQQRSSRSGSGRDSPSQITSSVRGSIRCIWLRSATSRIDSPTRPAAAGLTRPQTSNPSTTK